MNDDPKSVVLELSKTVGAALDKFHLPMEATTSGLCSWFSHYSKWWRFRREWLVARDGLVSHGHAGDRRSTISFESPFVI